MNYSNQKNRYNTQIWKLGYSLMGNTTRKGIFVEVKNSYGYELTNISFEKNATSSINGECSILYRSVFH